MLGKALLINIYVDTHIYTLDMMVSLIFSSGDLSYGQDVFGRSSSP